jgi:hypothetical protein
MGKKDFHKLHEVHKFTGDGTPSNQLWQSKTAPDLLVVNQLQAQGLPTSLNLRQPATR